MSNNIPWKLKREKIEIRQDLDDVPLNGEKTYNFPCPNNGIIETNQLDAALVLGGAPLGANIPILSEDSHSLNVTVQRFADGAGTLFVRFFCLSIEKV